MRRYLSAALMVALMAVPQLVFAAAPTELPEPSVDLTTYATDLLTFIMELVAVAVVGYFGLLLLRIGATKIGKWFSRA